MPHAWINRSVLILHPSVYRCVCFVFFFHCGITVKLHVSLLNL